MTGISGKDLYNQWAEDLSLDYISKTSHIVDEITGEIIEEEGGVNLYPTWNPNAEKFAFLSNRGHDYFSQTNLYVHDFESGKAKKIAGRVESKPTWINNSHILYSRRSKKNENGSTFFDLYKYDLNLKKETQLTISGRFTSPLVLEGKNKFIAFKTIDGSTNVYLSDINHVDLQQITNIDDGTVLFSATYNSNENKLILDGNDLHGRQLYLLDLENFNLEKISNTQWDTRNPNFQNGQLCYTEDKTGIFNIVCQDYLNKNNNEIESDAFKKVVENIQESNEIVIDSVWTRYEVKDGENLYKISKIVYGNSNEWKQIYNWNKKGIGENPNLIHPNISLKILKVRNEIVQLKKPVEVESHKSNIKKNDFKKSIKSYLTNVYGGAFMPDVNKNGDVLFSLYKNGEYEIAILKDKKTINEDFVGYNKNFFKSRPHSILISDKNNTEATDYKDGMSRPFILPKLMIDYNTVKYGFYLFSSEFLNRMNFIVGASVNSLKDKDLFAIFEYKKWKYTFYMNLFGIQRHKNNMDYKFFDSYIGRSDLKFTIFATDLGTKFPYKNHIIDLKYSYQKYRANQRWTFIEGSGISEYPAGYGYDYYRNHSLSLTGKFSTKKPQFLGNMLPQNGYDLNYNLMFDHNLFLNGFKEDQLQTEIFSPEHTFRTEVKFHKYKLISEKLNISAAFNGQIGVVSNQKIDDFFYYFNGGLAGLKGYTYYDTTLYGPNMMLLSTVIRKPVFTEKSIVIGPINLQNLSIGIIGQYGGGYSYKMNEIITGKPKNWFSEVNLGESVGCELRLAGFSFYSYPTAFSYEIHYPLANDYENPQPKHYFTILFDFQE